MANMARWKSFTCDTCQRHVQRQEPPKQDKSSSSSPSSPSNSSHTDPLTPISAHENVTQRRPRQLIPSLHQQNDSINLDLSYQSLPGVIENGEQLEDLRESNHKLRAELETANGEIENLSLEISSLKKLLAEKTKKIDLYKAVGLEDSIPAHKPYLKFYSPQYRKIQMGSARKTPLIYTSLVAQPDPKEKFTKILPTKDSKLNHNRPESSPGNTIESRAKNELESIQISAKKKTQSLHMHRIMILADEQGRGLRELLQKLLGEKFSVESVIKPYATMDQVLRSCSTLCKDYGENDCIIILGGSNDKDPVRLKSLLYYNLSMLGKTKIILCNVRNNMYLNENKVNYTYRHLCSRFANTTFLDLSDEEYFNRERFNKLYVCRVMLREILGIRYAQKIAQYAKSRQNLSGFGRTHLMTNTQTCMLTLADKQTQTDSMASADTNAKIEFFRSE